MAVFERMQGFFRAICFGLSARQSLAFPPKFASAAHLGWDWRACSARFQLDASGPRRSLAICSTGISLPKRAFALPFTC